MATTISKFPAKFGKYILLDRLAAGGMAEVFIAKAIGIEGFERLLAIKCMLPALLSDPNFAQMFVDEARLASQITHANVVQIYELGRQASRLYIAMELVQGHDLRHIVRTAKRLGVSLPPAFAAYIIGRAARGLDFAHRATNADGTALGIVHRDVSPQNLLVSYDGEVKVVDFGIAKASSEVRVTETQVGVLKGKFAYMAPEQVVGEPLDRRADIFALGAVFYEALTGTRCFTGENDLAVLEHVRDAVLPDLAATVPPEAHRALPVLQRALSQSPEHRYATAGEMAKALDSMLITGEHIFGPEQAASLMQGLFDQEVLRMSQALKRYGETTEQSCIVDLTDGGDGPGRAVFESSFAPSEPAPVTPTDTDAAEPVSAISVRRTTPGRQVLLSRRSTQPSQVVLEPKSGAHTLNDMTPLSQVFAPLQVAGKQPERELTDPNVNLPRTLRRRLRLTNALLLFILLGMMGTFGWLLSNGRGVAGLRERIAEAKTYTWLAEAREQLSSANVRRLLDEWLFGSDVLEDRQKGPQPTFGYVQIVVSGALHAHVFIDAEPVGYTPLTPQRVAVGPHKIRVEHKKPSGIIEQREAAVAITGREQKGRPALVQLVF